MTYTIGYLVLKEIRIENANAISSPITYGFPAISGFLGAIHAMGRELRQYEDFSEIQLSGVLIACRHCEPQIYRANPYREYTFHQSRHPLKKNGEHASIIEEGKVHLTVTLAVEVCGDDELSKKEEEELIALVQKMIISRRIAGGSVRGLHQKTPVSYFSPESVDGIIPLLFPAFVLTDARQDLIDLTEKMQKKNPNATTLDALIDVAALHHVPTEKNGAVEWTAHSAKTGRGWLVPLPIGFQGIAPPFEPGQLHNCRTNDYPSQYVEAVYSLGKWIFPHRIADITTAFWRYDQSIGDDFYLVTQEKNI